MTQAGRTLFKGALLIIAALALSSCGMFRSDDNRQPGASRIEHDSGGGLFGGVIITDWYSDPTTPSERFKATVYILDTRLRADALNVSIFRQTQVNGQWQDASVDPDTEIQIENAILTRARQLRLSTVRN